MKSKEFPDDIQAHLIPAPDGEMRYRCLECGQEYGTTELLYTCPECKGLFLLIDRNEVRLQEKPGEFWRRLFDYRRMLNIPALKGVFLYYELIAPVIPLPTSSTWARATPPRWRPTANWRAKWAGPFISRTTARTTAPPSRTGAWPRP